MSNHDIESNSIGHFPFIFITNIWTIFRTLYFYFKCKSCTFFSGYWVFDKSNSKFISITPMDRCLDIFLYRKSCLHSFPIWMLSINDILSFDFLSHKYKYLDICIQDSIYPNILQEDFFYFWCPRRDLNPHTLRHTRLRRTCLPIPPPGQAKKVYTKRKDCKYEKKNYHKNMQKNIFFYIQYSFSRLFSQKFWNIVGSSIGISFIMTLLTSLFSIGSGYSIYTLLKENSM